MIRLKIDCSDCIHVNVCQYKHNAKFAMDKFKKGMFISGISNESYTWEDKMAKDHVDVEFSCPDFEKKSQTLLREKM